VIVEVLYNNNLIYITHIFNLSHYLMNVEKSFEIKVNSPKIKVFKVENRKEENSSAFPRTNKNLKLKISDDYTESRSVRKKSKKLKKKKDKKGKNDSDESVEEENKDKEGEKLKESNDIILDDLIILMQLGKGAFGQIFLTYNKRDHIEIATKKEIRKSKSISPQLKIEFIVLKSLLNIQNINTNKITIEGTTNTPDLVDCSGKLPIPQDGIF